MTNPTPTDWRALCARMADELDRYRQLLMDDRRETHALASEARTALAEQPAGPTDEELDAKWGLPAGTVASWGPKPPPDVAAVIKRRLDRDIARGVLARWGRPAIEPVPQQEAE